MSLFKKRVDTFCANFNLPLSTRVSLYGHYPLFKAVWLNQHGRGVKAKVSEKIVGLAKNYSLPVSLHAKNKKAFPLSISFEPSNLDSFQEIFFGFEYQSPWSLDDCKSMIDLGANIGMATQYFLTQAPLEKVILVEANPALAKHLKTQLGRFNLDCQFEVQEVCVSGASGQEVEFCIDHNNRDSGIGRSGHNKETIRLKTIALSELISQSQWGRVDILKMDIEGAEHDIIDKEPESLKNFRYLFCEVHGESQQRESFHKQIENLGFEVKILSSQDPYHCSIIAAKNRDA
jgi:FkbM family methyltransferase